MKKFLIANWKMNPATCREAEALARAVSAGKRSKNTEVVLCPPFTYLSAISKILRSQSSIPNSFSLGAQDVFWEPRGPYTGEISPAMLKNSGVRYVIVGHSERRENLGETDAMVARKVKAATAAGLTAIVCVGEPWEVRRRGIVDSKEYVGNQLEWDLAIAHGARQVARGRRGKTPVIVTYEPRWAISTSSTGKACTPQNVADMANFIRRRLKEKFKAEGIPILYGGSVDLKNIRSYIETPGISGALVGAASLKATEFVNMVKLNT